MSTFENRITAKYDINDDHGINLDVEIYKDHEEDEFLSVYISHEGSSGAKYSNIKNEEDVGKAVAMYLETYI